MSFTSRRSQSALDFRRPSQLDSVSIHINPNRSRTPRNSIPQPPDSFTDSETERLSRANSNDEKTRLISISASNSDLSNNSAGSLEIFKNSIAKTLSLSVKVSKLPSANIFRHLKTVFIFIITAVCCGVIMTSTDKDPTDKITTVPQSIPVVIERIAHNSDNPYIRLKIRGPFNKTKDVYNGNQARIAMGYHDSLNVTIDETLLQNQEQNLIEHKFYCHGSATDDHCNLTITADIPISVQWEARQLSWQAKHEVVYAFLVLGFVYILIIFELVHRTVAAMLGALAAMAVLSAVNQRPSMEVLMSWLDMETLSLLFGMMVIVAIISETGFFDYVALWAYKIAKGKVWPLITLLCVLSAVISAFLDNVTTILLMAPVTIRLCEVLNLDPKQILIIEVLFSNIGGTATAIGDPPNVIIVGALSDKGIDFSKFTLHMFPGIVIISIVGYGLLRVYYRNIDQFENKDPPEIAEMKHEIQMWRRYANRMQLVTREETLMKALFLQKAVEMENFVNKTLHKQQKKEQRDLKETVKRLERQYRIKDVPLLIKSGFVLGTVILFLFMYSFVDNMHLEMGWIAVLGALWLLVVADVHDLENVLHKVEWSTLIFFASLFILMEALAELGMIKEIGDGVGNLIKSVDKDNRLLLAVVVILWVSAIASSFIDNIPFTTAMVPVLEQLSQQEDMHVPLLPMVIALAFGACLGGNGTLIGASCNVVCAGIAEQHGYGFGFKEFFKVGFPMMLLTTTVACVYVLICHVAAVWNT